MLDCAVDSLDMPGAGSQHPHALELLSSSPTIMVAWAVACQQHHTEIGWSLTGMWAL